MYIAGSVINELHFIGHVLLEQVQVQDLRESTGDDAGHTCTRRLQIHLSKIFCHRIRAIEW